MPCARRWEARNDGNCKGQSGFYGIEQSKTTVRLSNFIEIDQVDVLDGDVVRNGHLNLKGLGVALVEDNNEVGSACLVVR